MAFWLWAAAAAALAAALATIVLVSFIRIRIRYSRSRELDQVIIIVQALYGIVKIQTIVPAIMIRGLNIVYHQKSKSAMTGTTGSGNKDKRKINWRVIRKYARAFKGILRSTRNFKAWAIASMRKVECTRWRLDVTIGTGDAALTGIAAGLFWSVLGCAVGLTSHFVKLKAHPHGSVKPVFNGTEFSVVWEADFRIRLAAAAGSAISLGTRTIHLWKAMKAWRSWGAGPEHA